MSKKMINSKIIAERWEITVRRVNQMCSSGEIEGAIKVGGIWNIPDDVSVPDILRNKKKGGRVRTTKLLPCPVGITSYKEVSSECYYVDKTLLIKDIIDEHNKVTLFTRPRRFGKTLTMDMVKTFFEKSDEDTSVYFANRKIWECGELYKSYQGAYPVIFLSFKDAHQGTWNDMYESISMCIRNEFKRHMDILNSNEVSDIDKDFFRNALSGSLSEVECQASLGQLSHMLADAYRNRVIVIIDEYDTPIQQGYSNGYYDEVIGFMRNLFSAVLKDNVSLETGILTGILRVAKESLFSGLNNLIVNTILDEKYSDYFGFDVQDVEEMAKYYGREDEFAEISEWYDGYRFGKTGIYNPWSVISYFNNDCKPKAFWSRTSSNDMILEIVRNGNQGMQNSLMKLMQDEPVKAVVDSDIIYPEIGTTEDTVYSFLLMTGYLKIAKEIGRIEDNPVCELLIPNKEIKGVFKKEILDNLSRNMSQSVIRNFQLALKTNNKDELQGTLRQYLLESASSFDVAKEDFYHGMMLGLLAIMSDDYYITSNRESGEGRFDVQLRPIHTENAGILMEFKASDDTNEEKLEKLAIKAVKQAVEKKYATELKASGVKNIQIYGIAFSKKKATVRMMEA